jgi:hypothetical protein
LFFFLTTSRLTTNIRHRNDLIFATLQESIAKGTAGIVDDHIGMVQLPSENILPSTTSLETFIHAIYGDFQNDELTINNCILTPLNDDTQDINARALSIRNLPKTCLWSSDTEDLYFGLDLTLTV